MAPASIALPLPEQKGLCLRLRVALIRDLCRQVPLPPSEEERDYPKRWDADLNWEDRRWWETGWQATPDPQVLTSSKLIPNLPDGRRLHFSVQVNQVARPILDVQKYREA